MKKKWIEPFRKLHWSSKLLMETGTALADALLLAACAWCVRDALLSVQMVQTSVQLFAIGIVGGLFLDVIAKRMGVEEKEKQKQKDENKEER